MNSKSIISFIGPIPPPLGGVAVMNESIQKLLKDDYQIKSFNTSRGKEQEDLYNINILKKVMPQLKRIFSFFEFAKDDSYKITNLFVTSGIGFIREAIYIIILKLFKKKIIVHFHSKKQGEFFLKPFNIKILSFFLNKCDKIILLSNDHKNYFQDYFIHEKLEIIENFVDYSLYENDITQKRNEFLYVGRLSEAKGFFDLLKAIKLLKEEFSLNIKFHIVGLAENNNSRDKISKLIIDYNIQELAILHGAKFDKDKYELFKNCKYFIFPSHFENSPVVLKEAIASNMIIFSSDLDANKNVLHPLKNVIYFSINNSKEMSEKIYLNILDTNNINEEIYMGYDKNIAKISLLNVFNELNSGDKIET